MSSEAQTPAGELESEEETQEVPHYPGAAVRAVCTGCKQKRSRRVLRRHVSRPEIEEGAGFEDACATCRGVEPHTILEVYQEISAKLGSIYTRTDP